MSWIEVISGSPSTKTSEHRRLAAVAVVVLLGGIACEGETPSTVATGTGGGGGVPGGGTGGTIGGGGTAGAEPVAPVCPTAAYADPPSPEDDCSAVRRGIDPESTCAGNTPCPITRALDLSCGFSAVPRLSLGDDRALLLSSDLLTTVTETETEFVTLGGFLGGELRFNLLPSGETWFFATGLQGIVAISESGDAWAQSSVTLDPEGATGGLSDARMVDATRGYVAYRMAPGDIPHLVTWDGSCWTDEVLSTGRATGITVAVDDQGLLWTALVTTDPEGLQRVALRDPTGATEQVPAAAPKGAYAAGSDLKLLPGGLGGDDPYPTLALRSAQGIELIRRDPERGWFTQGVPGSAVGTRTSDCPMYDISVDPEPCEGQPATCTTELDGNGPYFDLARTESRGAFAVWVSYSSHANSTLTGVLTREGELPGFSCLPTETTGTGRADLVVARLGEAEPVVTRYPFDLEGGLLYFRQPVAVAARGDTLIVTAVVSGGDEPDLTYFEIDTTLLP